MKKMFIGIGVALVAVIALLYFFLAGSLLIKLTNTSGRGLKGVVVKVCETERKIESLEVNQVSEIHLRYSCEGAIKLFVEGQETGQCFYLDGKDRTVLINFSGAPLTENDCKSTDN